MLVPIFLNAIPKYRTMGAGTMGTGIAHEFVQINDPSHQANDTRTNPRKKRGRPCPFFLGS